MTRIQIRALVWALGALTLVTLAIVVGSRRLSHFDAALVAYTFATLFAVSGVTYRYAIWLQRPPTALFWRRGWASFFRRGFRARNAVQLLRRSGREMALNGFIWRRDRLRWLTHMLIMWGCLLAAAITFPLVFGWMSFESLPDRIDWYRIYLFGFPTIAIPHDSWLAFLVFHGLVWAAFLVTPGVMLALRRRMRDAGAGAVQHFSEDFLPLILLFAVSITGLLLTVSFTWLKGFGYEFLSLTHAVTVIFTLLWLPFGKFFHIFQRPAQMGVSFYKDVAEGGEAMSCARCAHPFASRMHVEDLIRVEEALGFQYAIDGNPDVTHYQQICPRCRRALLALAQGSLLPNATSTRATLPRPMPLYANPGMGEGPLGDEDATNFHP